MIEGRFGTKGQIYFDIDLVGDDGLILPTEVMLDTGFTEFLAINSQDAAGEAIQEILLGSRWLKQFILVANYQQTQVTLG